MAVILIVDDDAANREIAAELLAVEGHEVVEAPTGEKALARLRQGGVGLVLLDIDMPDMNGVEVLKNIRSNPLTEGIPVIAHTAVADPSDRDYFRARGFDDLICKPVNIRSMASTCGAWIEKRKAA